jgi:hypothetical protein
VPKSVNPRKLPTGKDLFQQSGEDLGRDPNRLQALYDGSIIQVLIIGIII